MRKGTTGGPSRPKEKRRLAVAGFDGIGQCLMSWKLMKSCRNLLGVSSLGGDPFLVVVKKTHKENHNKGNAKEEAVLKGPHKKKAVFLVRNPWGVAGKPKVSQGQEKLLGRPTRFAGFPETKP